MVRVGEVLGVLLVKLSGELLVRVELEREGLVNRQDLAGISV